MYCLGQWLHYLYHVNDVFRVTVDVMSDRSGITCRVECVCLSLNLINVCKALKKEGRAFRNIGNKKIYIYIVSFLTNLLLSPWRSKTTGKTSLPFDWIGINKLRQLFLLQITTKFLQLRQVVQITTKLLQIRTAISNYDKRISSKYSFKKLQFNENLSI